MMANAIDYSRMKRLIYARTLDAEEAERIETEISKEIVSPQTLEKDAECRRGAHMEVRHLTPFAATEQLAVVLDGHLSPDQRGKYDPKFAKSRTVEDLWKMRQVVDQVGLPYGFYVENAVTFVGKRNGRAPRLSMLTARNVVAHVATEWVRML